MNCYEIHYKIVDNNYNKKSGLMQDFYKVLSVKNKRQQVKFCLLPYHFRVKVRKVLPQDLNHLCHRL